MIRALLVFMAIVSPARADMAGEFVTANVLSTFYHEFGHALIDVAQLPVLGQEEDAADMLSVVLLDAFWEEETAQAITAHTALSFELAAEDSADEEPPFWDVHGLDMQRYYNQICLFYGADPETRADLAEEFELPEDRAESCPEEFDLAAASWDRFLTELETTKPGKTLIFAGDASGDIGALLADEIADLNAAYALPRPIEVTLDDCGEANAFYDPEAAKITICTEYVDFLKTQAQKAGL